MTQITNTPQPGLKTTDKTQALAIGFDGETLVQVRIDAAVRALYVDHLVAQASGSAWALEIQYVKPGMDVLARSAATSESVWREVSQIFRHPSKQLFDINYRYRTEDGVYDERFVRVAGDRLFWVVGASWVKASALKTGDRLLMLDGQEARITGYEQRLYANDADLYDLALADSSLPFSQAKDVDSFFVSWAQLLVHDMRSPM